MMEKVATNSKFVGHSTEIIWQSKIRAPLSKSDQGHLIIWMEQLHWKMFTKRIVLVNPLEGKPTENFSKTLTQS